MSLTRQPWWRRWFGTRSEDAAARFLQALGYRVLARNYRCQIGEIDLVALNGKTIVFVEVRSTERDDTARPAHSVDATKQHRLTQLALHFLQKHKLMNRPARFDVLTISWPEGKTEPLISHFRDAFDASDSFQMFS